MRFYMRGWSAVSIPALVALAAALPLSGTEMPDAGREARGRLPRTRALAVVEPRTGIRMTALTEKASPVLKLLLPGQDAVSRGIEIEFPEHAWGRPRGTQEQRQLYFISRREDLKRPFTWTREGRTLGYTMELREGVTLVARAELEQDGVRMRYRFVNRSATDYEQFQAVTCTKLYDRFEDNFLERTYVHHPDGFDLLASETPERLRMTRQQWLPCRYLVSYTWPVPPRERRIETVEGIRRYNKARRVDQPFLATRSRDGKWIAATSTRETGNLWTNPERTCQHADPATELKAGETREVELKLLLFRGKLDQLLERVDKERLSRERTAPANPLQTVGLYVSLPTDPPPTDPIVYDFYKACGYNYLEFCEAGFRSRPDLLPAYYKELSHAIDIAHQKGLRVGIVLLAGMEQWKGPGKTGAAGAFSPLDRAKLQERLTYLRQAVEQLPNADSFVFFPGDPGGDPRGRSTLEDCVAFSRQVRQIVKQEAPGATFLMNLWAIAEWEGFPSPMSLRFWQQEVRLSRAAAAAPDLLGPDCGVAFPLHNYYRSLALRCYAAAGLDPEPHPTEDEVRALRARGVRPLLGWPYFLVDEVDDGFIKPNNVESRGQSSVETRYIGAIVDRGRALGLDGLVANAIFIQDEALNIYAFGQMCRSPELTPGQLIDRYAGLVADGNSRRALGRVLRYIENHSNWQISRPERSRLANFDLPDVTSAAAALKLLAQVKPRARPPIPLPEAPALYLGRLKKRLEAIAAGRIGGFNPIRVERPR